MDEIDELSFFKVSLNDFSKEVIDKAKNFAKKVIGETHDRFEYPEKRREEVIFIGKIAEEVFVKFIKQELGIDLKVNYEIYEGTANVDKDDFIIEGIPIDIKSSKDTKNEGIKSCYSRFNFPVPKDQEIKDITVSIIYDNDVQNFYIVSWIDKETYTKNASIRALPIGGGITKEFYLYPLKKGKKLNLLIDYLKQ